MPVQFSRCFSSVIKIFSNQCVFFPLFQEQRYAIRLHAPVIPRVYHLLSIDIQPTTVIGSKSQCIFPRNCGYEIATPTNRQGRLRQERIRCLIGRFKINIIIYTYFRSTCQIFIIIILSFQTIRKIRLCNHLISRN